MSRTGAGHPALTPASAEVLLDLIEIKLSHIEVWDREDARERRALERAKAELSTWLRRSGAIGRVPITGHARVTVTQQYAAG